MKVKLRSLGSGDELLLWEYLYMALFVPAGEPPPPREIIRQPTIARYVANWGRLGDRGLLAIESRSGRDLGAAWLRLWFAGETGYGFVDLQTPELSMAVRQEYRGQGIGTLLLQRMFADADGRFPAMSLSVANANPALRLYKRFGFVPVASALGSTTMRWGCTPSLVPDAKPFEEPGGDEKK